MAENKYGKLPKAFKKKWIAALKSGQYDQARHRLASKSGWCCLGVAANVCEIGGEHLLKRSYLHEVKNAKSLKSKRWNELRKRIPVALRENRELQNKLAIMNDQYHPFERIADWIEKEL